MNRSIYLFLTFLTVCVGACHKNVEEVDELQFPEEPGILVSTTATGQVTDENGKTLAGLKFELAQQTWQASQQDFYVLKAFQIKKYGERLRVTDQTGAHADFALTAIENDINYEVHTFFKDRQRKTFAPNTTPTWIFGDQLTVKAVPNSFQKNGSNYSGAVVSEAYEADLQKTYHRRAIPASRRGREISGSYKYLKVQRAFHLQLLDVGLNPITCDLTLTEPKLQLGSADTKLWFFNFDLGHWVEMEKKTASAHQVTFNFAQNGWYCLAPSAPGVFASGRLVSELSAIPNIHVNFSNEYDVQTFYTSGSGKWTAYLPANSKIVGAVQAPCGEIFNFKFETGSTEVKNLETDLSSVSNQFARVKGIVKDCEGKPMQSYLLRSAAAGGTTYYRNGASLDQLIPICNEAELLMSTANEDGTEVGNIVAWPKSAIIESGSWFACNQAKGPYFNLVIEGENKLFWDAKTIKNQNGRLEFRMTDFGKNQPDITLFAPGDGVGEKPDNVLNILLQADNFNGKSFEIYCPSSPDGCGFERFSITHFDYKGDKFIRGFFKGKFWTKSYGPLKASYKQMEGEFQVKKEF